jgi:hypothetical protein
MVARPGARPHGDDDPTTRLRFHLYDAPLRRSCCCRCYADCRPHFRLGSGGGLYSAHNTFFHWCRTPSSSDPPRLRFVASTSSALPRLCPGASCASSNREFVLKKLCPKSPWVYSLSFAYAYMRSYDGTPAFAHSLRPRRPAPRPPLMPLVAPPPRVLLPRPPGLTAPPAAAAWAADRVRVHPAHPPAFAAY